MHFRVEVVDSVLLQLEEAIRYYEQISPDLGIAFEEEVAGLFDKLSQTPHHYFNLNDQIHRRISFRQFPYMFVYQIIDDRVLIKILFPAKADPASILEVLH